MSGPNNPKQHSIRYLVLSRWNV